jgi:hypothetical protein
LSTPSHATYQAATRRGALNGPDNSVTDDISLADTSDSATVVSITDSTTSLKRTYKGPVGDIVQQAEDDGYAEVLKHVFPGNTNAAIQDRLRKAAANNSTPLKPEGSFVLYIRPQPSSHPHSRLSDGETS